MARKMLFGSDVGLFSLLTIPGVIGIGAFMYLFFQRRIEDEERGHTRN